MKKGAVLFLLMIGISLIASAQISPRAIGLRFGGDGSINGAEISYQQKMGKANRLELDFGYAFSSVHSRLFVVGIYHWHWNIKDGLNWYAGPGASAGLFAYDGGDGYLNIGLGGQIGLEYNFNKHDLPLLLSIDARPIWDFLGSNAGLGWGASLGLRYTW